VICAYDECNNEFQPKTHNQKYCSDECCRTATNIKIKEKYYEKKERLRGKERICKTSGCKTKLSRYNEDPHCSKCEALKNNKEKNKMMKDLGLVSN
jgi:hypothetical protein